jgi:hypothetical protein
VHEAPLDERAQEVGARRGHGAEMAVGGVSRRV